MAVVLLLVAVLLAACGDAGDEETPAAAVHRDAAAALSVPVPAGWRVAPDSLTPWLVDPHEVLSLGTGALTPAGARGCAHMPEAAVRALGPQDVLVSLQERDGAAGGFPPRRRPFALGRPRPGDAAACARREGEVAEHWVPFRDAGRSFYALVVLGRAVPQARRRELRRVLDGLAVGRREARSFALPRVAVRGELPSGWKLAERRLTAAVGLEHQVAAGTYAVPDGPPDPNCAPSPALDRLPARGAFVFVFEYPDPAPRLLRRFPPRPRAFRLPQEAQPYECFGESLLVRWREHGRAFQAHVSLGRRAPLRRRVEALAFLDALQVAPR